MSDDAIYHLNLFIDDLTNSIRRIDNGQSFETDVVAATKADLDVATRINQWHFPWITEFRKTDRTVYKLIKRDEPIILQGLVSLTEGEDHVYVHLAETAPINFGAEKVYEGVGGNLFAFACKTSWDNKNEGIVGFQSKTKLIRHYENILGATHIGGGRMIIYPEAALVLIKQYYTT